AGDAETRVRRRPRQTGHVLRLRCGDRRRRPCDVDRGGVDRGKSLARPADVRAGAGLPGLRLRAAQGLRRAGTSGGAEPARADGASPPLFRPCRRGPRKASGHDHRGRYDRHSDAARYRDFRRDLTPVASAPCGLYQFQPAASIGDSGQFMRFTSLVIELIRARPRLVVWIVVLLQAALWLVLPLVLYRSPPGDLATVLAFGREYQVGTDLGPPLAFWLADIAFRIAGNHMIGVYLLAQVCAVSGFWTLYLLARAVVGGQQAVLAILLTMTVAAFSSPGVEFGPL